MITSNNLEESQPMPLCARRCFHSMKSFIHSRRRIPHTIGVASFSNLSFSMPPPSAARHVSSKQHSPSFVLCRQAPALQISLILILQILRAHVSCPTDLKVSIFFLSIVFRYCYYPGSCISTVFDFNFGVS